MSKASTPVAMSDDAKWRAEDDARTVIRAQEILGDPKRKTAAVAQLKKQAEAANAAVAHATAVKEVGAEIKKVFGGK